MLSNVHLLQMQKSLSSADLVTMLTNLARKDGHVLHQLYTLFDGTTASLSSVPDIEVFKKKATGELVS